MKKTFYINSHKESDSSECIIGKPVTTLNSSLLPLSYYTLQYYYYLHPDILAVYDQNYNIRSTHAQYVEPFHWLTSRSDYDVITADVGWGACRK